MWEEKRDYEIEVQSWAFCCYKKKSEFSNKLMALSLGLFIAAHGFSLCFPVDIISTLGFHSYILYICMHSYAQAPSVCIL